VWLQRLDLERYGHAEQTDGAAVYDRALEAFSAAAERPSYTWTRWVMPRMGQIADLPGRTRLKDALVRLGSLSGSPAAHERTASPRPCSHEPPSSRSGSCPVGRCQAAAG
jgi:hypothetical protein